MIYFVHFYIFFFSNRNDRNKIKQILKQNNKRKQLMLIKINIDIISFFEFFENY